MEAIIFDLGGVLIDWNPLYLYNNTIKEDEKRSFFLEKICSADWNEEQDAGRSLSEATEQLILEHPDWEPHIRDYYGRWEEMLAGPIDETVEIFRRLKENTELKFYALTNWSAELFPVALKKYDFLHWFDGRVVSGEEKMRKPAPAFYQIVLDRFDLQPQQTLFIDDNHRNILAAEKMGIPSIHFKSPAQLRQELERLGLPV